MKYKIISSIILVSLMVNFANFSVFASFSGGGSYSTEKPTKEELIAASEIFVDGVGNIFYFADSGISIEIKTFTGKGNVIIPEQINGKNVTSIGDYAFEECKDIISVSIPNTLSKLGIYAFNDCLGMTGIIGFENTTVRKIGTFAFSGCESLKNISLPSTILEIGTSAFYGCINLTEIILPYSLTKIGSTAFGNCTSLKSINIPSSVTKIENWAFDFSESDVFFGYFIDANFITSIDELSLNGTNLSGKTLYFKWGSDNSTAIRGDITGDWSVDIFDLIALRKAVLYSDKNVSLEAADLNLDGKINISDIIYLKRHLGEWDNYNL